MTARIDLGPLGVVELEDERRADELPRPIRFALKTERRQREGAMAMDAGKMTAALMAALRRRFKTPEAMIEAMAEDQLFSREELSMLGKSGFAYDQRGGRRLGRDDEVDREIEANQTEKNRKRAGLILAKLGDAGMADWPDDAKQLIQELAGLAGLGGGGDAESEEDVEGRRGSPAAQDAPPSFPGRPETGGTMTPLDRNAGASGRGSLDYQHRQAGDSMMSHNAGMALDAAGRKLAAQIGRRGSSSGRGFFERFKDAKRIGTF